MTMTPSAVGACVTDLRQAAVGGELDRWRTRRRRPRPLRVAMIGQKGVPATFGGIERHVEELGARLAAGGVAVTVYCRRSYSQDVPAVHRGMRLVVTPTLGSKHLDALVHSLTSTVHAVVTGADVIHYHALGPGLAAPLARLARSNVVLTVHGLDQDRAKWSGLAQRVLRAAYWMSGHVPQAVVTVSKALAQRYKDDFGCRAVYIPNGVAQATLGQPLGRLGTQLGIEPNRYVLFVGRIVPEKRPDLLVRVARYLPDGVKLVIVGDSSFSDDYVSTLREAAGADETIVLPGYLFGSDLAAVFENAAVFVQPSDVEGLPLTLLEALSYGIPVVASGIAPHREIMGHCQCPGHRLFPVGDADALARELVAVLGLGLADRTAVKADCELLLDPYDWDRAADALLALYHALADGVVDTASQVESNSQHPSGDRADAVAESMKEHKAVGDV